MAPRARERRTCWTAALLAVAALVPALHDALSHHALEPGEKTSVAAALPATGAPAGGTCPICVASKQASALLAPSGAHPVTAVAAIARAPFPPLVASGVVLGAASPRAPPS